MTKMKAGCPVCGRPFSKYVMNNKRVCIKCDDLLFDLEIECNDDDDTNPKLRSTTKGARTIRRNVVPEKK